MKNILDVTELFLKRNSKKEKICPSIHEARRRDTDQARVQLMENGILQVRHDSCKVS